MSVTNCEGGASSCAALTTHSFPQGETVDVLTCVAHQKGKSQELGLSSENVQLLLAVFELKL